jgi:hypothetical protein
MLKLKPKAKAVFMHVSFLLLFDVRHAYAVQTATSAHCCALPVSPPLAS